MKRRALAALAFDHTESDLGRFLAILGRPGRSVTAGLISGCGKRISGC